MLTGLRGGADFNRNGLIEIRELFDFTYRTVKTSTEGFQNPSIEGRYDNGLPLAFAPGGPATSLTQETSDPKDIPASDRELVRLRAELQALQEHMAREKSDWVEDAAGSRLIAKAPAFSSPQAFAPKILGGDGAPMVIIPEGHFTMGSKDFRNERPAHRVFLDNFYIDQHEVTVSQYADFIKKSGAEPPGYWMDLNLTQVSQHPAVRVNWDEATAYCESMGKRLPTEAEWEKAARGTDERLYPWGEQDPIQILANFDKCCDHQAYSVLTSVGEKAEGRSPYGLDDMAGNVWEWTADWYDTSYYQRSPDKNPQGPPVGELKTIRGGSWSNKAVDIRTTNRHGLDPAQRHDNVGFRCAKNAS